ncbi:hypothetical protein FHW67_000721 [Herbaspirillum sp. Sphag1AN]|uniref:hypothetical protein n=1 Tax=unclassified Herbaspirillum TaxID=2624150 RepID=UPI00160C7D7F|nr:MULTISPECIES: hypothetical protein [unclassified Herbaspirillum]MBB3211473.1 hypothetical protein [Herbaspirillum sp. Sphag1AN]MBB3245261.1 hypothetical protein [Herbaspirillum sp. Sphag64]
MDQILKSLWLKRVVWFFIVIGGLWYVMFRLPIVDYAPGPNGNTRFYSPNCAYYVLYRQSLWENFADHFVWSLATVSLYDKTGKLLYESKTSPGDKLMPIWMSGRQNSVLQGDTTKWWEADLPASPGDILHPENCLAQNK